MIGHRRNRGKKRRRIGRISRLTVAQVAWASCPCCLARVHGQDARATAARARRHRQSGDALRRSGPRVTVLAAAVPPGEIPGPWISGCSAACQDFSLRSLAKAPRCTIRRRRSSTPFAPPCRRGSTVSTSRPSRWAKNSRRGRAQSASREPDRLGHPPGQ